MNSPRAIHAGLMLMVLFVWGSATGSHVRATSPTPAAQAQANPIKGYLPMMSKSGNAPPPAPPAGKLPDAIVGTWFTGAIPPTDFYDPTTGQWRDTNGLGQMYIFTADGSYTYAGFLRLQNGACRSEVSTYQKGKAQATGATITLTPSTAKTRTVIVCGSQSDTTTDGPFDPRPITWATSFNNSGIEQLTLTDNGTATSFGKQGMAQALVGAWQSGAVRSTNFYDPATQTFAPQNGAGAWYRFNVDGTYTFGEFGFGQDAQGCQLMGWVYQTGTLEVSGGSLTTKPQSGVARVENACTPGQPQQQSYVEVARSFAWLLRDRTTEPKLVLIPLERFEELVFTRE